MAPQAVCPSTMTSSDAKLKHVENTLMLKPSGAHPACVPGLGIFRQGRYLKTTTCAAIWEPWLTTSICCHGLHPPSATWPDLVMRVNAYTITMLSYVMVCHVLLYYVISYHIKSYHIISYHILSCHMSLHHVTFHYIALHYKFCCILWHERIFLHHVEIHIVYIHACRTVINVYNTY